MDLSIIIFCCNSNYFSGNSAQKIVDDYIDYCLDIINLSMNESKINMKRVSKLLLTLLRLKFFGFENHSLNLSEEERVEKLEKIRKILENEDDKNFIQIVKLSRIRRAEEFYTNMLAKESNPLAKIVVVGLLRAMLKLATLNRGNSNNDKCNKKFNFFRFQC